MTETLGEAVLYLRTDDRALDAGMAKAKSGAQGVSMTFDKAAASSGKLSRAFTTTGKASDELGQSMVRQRARGREMVISAGAQRAGMQQLSMQLGDVATMYSMGMRPMQIYTSQIGQVTQAIALMRGGAGGLVGFLAGPWGMAITTASIVLVPFVSKLFEAESAAKAAEEGADGLAQAQSALGDVFDVVSGKLKTQNELLILNARLMAINLRAEATAKRATARESLAGAASAGAPSFTEAQTIGIAGLGQTRGQANASALRQMLLDIGAGRITRDEALKRSETMDFTGTKATRQEFQQALIDATVANINERAADLIDQSLDSGQLASELRQPGRTKRDGAKRDRGPSAAEVEQRHQDELGRLRQEEITAQVDLATNAHDRADLQMDLLREEYLERAEQLANDEHFTAEQKKAQQEILDRLYGVVRASDGTITVGGPGLLQQGISREKQRRLEQEAEQLADEQFRAQTDALRTELELAETEKQRKEIALRIFDAETAYLRSKLEAVETSQTANDAEKQRARIALEALNAGAAARRESVARANETEVERYLRHLNKTPQQINEAIDGIKIDGLEALNDGIIDAVMGAKSLGEVFHNVAKQIVADLLRIAVQRAIIGPLANMIFPGAGAPANLLSGTPFAGAFATGGLIPAGSWGIVGEEGPEPVIGTSRGTMVLPNSTLGAIGGRTVVELRVRRGEMFEAAVEQISGNVAVRTVQEATPGLVEVSAGETARRLSRTRI